MHTTSDALGDYAFCSRPQILNDILSVTAVNLVWVAAFGAVAYFHNAGDYAFLSADEEKNQKPLRILTSIDVALFFFGLLAAGADYYVRRAPYFSP